MLAFIPIFKWIMNFIFMNFIKLNVYFISLNHCHNYKLGLWQYKNSRVCLLESETREWFKCVGHLKKTSTLDCVQTFYFIMWSLHASTCYVSKISISANSKVPCLYQLYRLYRLYPSCTYVCTDCTSTVYIYLYWLYSGFTYFCTPTVFLCTTTVSQITNSWTNAQNK